MVFFALGRWYCCYQIWMVHSILWWCCHSEFEQFVSLSCDDGCSWIWKGFLHSHVWQCCCCWVSMFCLHFLMWGSCYNCWFFEERVMLNLSVCFNLVRGCLLCLKTSLHSLAMMISCCLFQVLFVANDHDLLYGKTKDHHQHFIIHKDTIGCFFVTYVGWFGCLLQVGCVSWAI
jgi:hypothetical protein